MKIYLFLCTLFLFSFAEKESYFNHIYKAEQYIITNDYKKAQDEYIIAFNSHETGRANDYLNMVICSKKLFDIKRTKQYLDSCFISGYKYVDIYSTITNSNNELHIDYSKHRADSFHTIYLKYKKSTNYHKLCNLKAKDSTLTSLFTNGLISRYTLDSTYFEIGKAISIMILNDEIPKKEVFNFNVSRMRSVIPWTIIRHYFGMHNSAYNMMQSDPTHTEFYSNVYNDSSFYNNLLNLIDRGLLSPQILKDGLIYRRSSNLYGSTDINAIITYKENKGGENIVFEELTISQKIIYKEKLYSKKEILQFNKNRSSIQLCSFEHEIAVLESMYSSKINAQSDQFFMFNDGNSIRPLMYNNKNYKLIKVKKDGIKLIGKKIGSRNWKDIEYIEKAKITSFKL